VLGMVRCGFIPAEEGSLANISQVEACGPLEYVFIRLTTSFLVEGYLKV